jgi:PIN domain nuclease of toxin-antitoxin system
VRLLLDTHIWLWMIAEPHRLRRRVSNAVSDASNELWLSPISAWEAVRLALDGRIDGVADADEWIDRLLGLGLVKEAAITNAVAVEAWRIVLPHKDPADRLIAATARVEGLTLVTSDRKLQRIDGVDVLSNR